MVWDAVGSMFLHPHTYAPHLVRGEQLLFERQVELFLEGHALGDIHRYDLPLVPPPDTPYPTGGFYGGDRCIPMPDVERVNNPNVPSS